MSSPRRSPCCSPPPFPSPRRPRTPAHRRPPRRRPPRPPRRPPAQWKAQAKAGFVSTGGNSQTTTLTAGANVSRADAANKVALEGVVGYGKSSLRVVRDRPTVGLPGVTEPEEVGRDPQTTVNNWMVKARYDRFVTATQGAFAAASIGADEIAGKRVIGGGQAGWSAKLLKTPLQELVAELASR